MECDGEVDDVCHWLLQCSAWNSFRQPLLKAMNGVGEDFLTKAMETEQPFIITCMYRNYTFYLSLTLCGQHCSYIIIIDPSFFTYDSV